MRNTTSSLKELSVHYSLFLILAGFLGVLAGCGGGSSGGSGGPSATSVSGVYSGSTTVAYFHIPRLIDTVFASSTSYSPGRFTLSLNSNNQFGLTDQQGNTGGGTYTISGSSISLTGTLYLINSCTSSTATACAYSISSSGMTIGSSGAVSGTLDLSLNGSVVYTSPINVSPVTLPTVALTSLEGKSFTSTFGTPTNPGPLACPNASTFVGSVPASVNGSQVYIPCLTWNTYPAGSMSSSTPHYFTPTNGANMTMTFCSTIGSDCTPYSGMASGSRPYGTLTNVPPNALVFYVTTTGTTSPSPGCGNPTSGPSNCGIGVNGVYRTVQRQRRRSIGQDGRTKHLCWLLHGAERSCQSDCVFFRIDARNVSVRRIHS